MTTADMTSEGSSRAPASPHLRDRAEELLRDLAGPSAVLRDDQWTAIEALVVHHRRALVVQRTGWGKSAVYFISARLLREQGLGPTVIVSPLLALMRNQVAAAERAGVKAATINSGNVTEWDEVHQKVNSGELDVLLVSPERLNNPDFRDQVLPSLSADAGLVVVDEAHCVSDWGHDFRPDYRRIRTLVAELRDGIPVLATTATANDRVVDDVAAQLGVGGADTTILRGGLERESLHLSVVRIPDPTARMAWLAEHLETLPGSGIVYTLTVAAANDLAALLRDRGLTVAAYTGQTDPAEREVAEQDLQENRVKALIATSALGMGFDKPDLGFVVHVGAPSSPISYYQQVGRAGRATDRAEVVLLPGPEDRQIWSYFASVAFPREHVVRRVLEVLDPDKPQSTQALEPMVELNRTRLEMVLKVLDVDGAVHRVRGGWLGTGQPWTYDRERYERLDEARLSEQRAMIEYENTSECRMAFLRRQLDDPGLTGDPEQDRCGRCDNCSGATYSVDVDAATVESTRKRLDRPGLDLPFRKQWPTGLKKVGVELSGKITDGPETGRVLGRMSDPVWGPRLRALVDGPDEPAPDALEKACITVLANWTWETRPTSVMVMDRPGHNVLLRDLGERLSSVGRLTNLGVLAMRPDLPPVSAANSAFKVAGLVDAFDPPDLSSTDGPILLLDLLSDTGWTLTMAARALRHAGADAVLPFALATPK